MHVFCLGGAGRICREAANDFVEFGDCDRITIGDHDPAAAAEVAAWLNDPRVDHCRIDVTRPDEAARIMEGVDVVMDGLTISLNDHSTHCIALAGAHGVNLNGFGAEVNHAAAFRANGKTCVPGFGMTPGTTNMMAKHAAAAMETVDTVRVSHGAFRPVAFSAAIAETTSYEYDPELPGRVVYENGQFVQVPPFARPRDITLPEPYGTHTQYIIPHSETVTLAAHLQDKGVQLIEVRGTWPPRNMTLVRALYDFGFLRNETVAVRTAEGEVHVPILDAVAAHLRTSPEGATTSLYGYALHVEVTGAEGGRAVRRTLTHTHPASDGSVPGWEGLRAYTRNVGVPMAVAARILARGDVAKTGVVTPEEAFDPAEVFAELAKRGIAVHETVDFSES